MIAVIYNPTAAWPSFNQEIVFNFTRREETSPAASYHHKNSVQAHYRNTIMNRQKRKRWGYRLEICNLTTNFRPTAWPSLKLWFKISCTVQNWKMIWLLIKAIYCGRIKKITEVIKTWCAAGVWVIERVRTWCSFGHLYCRDSQRP